MTALAGSARRVDLRLVPAALGVWAVALTGLYVGWVAVAAVGGVAAAACLVSARTGGVPDRSAGWCSPPAG